MAKKVTQVKLVLLETLVKRYEKIIMINVINIWDLITTG